MPETDYDLTKPCQRVDGCCRVQGHIGECIVTLARLAARCTELLERARKAEAERDRAHRGRVDMLRGCLGELNLIAKGNVKPDAIALSGAALDAVRAWQEELRQCPLMITDGDADVTPVANEVLVSLCGADVYDVREVIPLLRALRRWEASGDMELPTEFYALAPHWRKLGEGDDDE